MGVLEYMCTPLWSSCIVSLDISATRPNLYNKRGIDGANVNTEPTSIGPINFRGKIFLTDAENEPRLPGWQACIVFTGLFDLFTEFPHVK